MKVLIVFVRFVINCLRYVYEIFRSKRNPDHIITSTSYGIMRKLDTITAGYSSSMLSRVLTERMTLPSTTFSDTIDSITHLGFIRLNNAPQSWINDLAAMPVFSKHKAQEKASIADLLEENIGRLEIDEKEIFANSRIAQLVTEGPWRNIAREYFKADPIAVLLTAWWSKPCCQDENVLSSSAQMFHRDCDWLRELKFFFYGCDVGESNGPFEYIQRSHNMRRDQFFGRDGRFSEKEVRSAYKSELISLAGAKGSVFAVNTRGLHRGKPVQAGLRLILQLEFSPQKFGAELQYVPRIWLNPSWDSFAIWDKALSKNSHTWSGLFRPD